MKYLVKGMRDERGGGRTLVEEAPVAIKGSNGTAERAAQEIEGRVRVPREAAKHIRVEFGEEVLYKRKPGAKMEKTKSRWETLIFVKVDRGSNEILVSDEDGIRK
eukprot:10767720-Karenia_brevis.AAC.1